MGGQPHNVLSFLLGLYSEESCPCGDLHSVFLPSYMTEFYRKGKNQATSSPDATASRNAVLTDIVSREQLCIGSKGHYSKCLEDPAVGRSQLGSRVLIDGLCRKKALISGKKYRVRDCLCFIKARMDSYNS